MLKKLALPALILSLVRPALHAGALEDAYGAAAKAARRAQDNPCAENKDFEKRVFRFRLDGTNGSGSIDVRFSFGSCAVTDELYDHHGAIPKALRAYKGDYGDYTLFVETEQGSSESSVMLVQLSRASSLGTHSNASLLEQRIDFSSAAVMDGDKKLTGPAFLLSYDPTPKTDPHDGPTGCQ